MTGEATGKPRTEPQTRRQKSDLSEVIHPPACHLLVNHTVHIQTSSPPQPGFRIPRLQTNSRTQIRARLAL